MVAAGGATVPAARPRIRKNRRISITHSVIAATGAVAITTPNSTPLPSATAEANCTTAASAAIRVMARLNTNGLSPSSATLTAWIPRPRANNSRIAIEISASR